MNISKSLIGVSIAFGVCVPALTSRADVFVPNFTVIETHSVGAGNTAGSFAASAMMGAKGHSNQPLLANWEAAITAQCASRTGSSPWPGGCNPMGMAGTLASLTSQNWVQFTWAEPDQVSALNEIVGSLKFHGSPAIVPVYGQADHWVSVVQVTATPNGTGWTIGNVKFYDGGPPDELDGSTNSYQGGLISSSGSTWKFVYFKILMNINPACDPCTSDPWYNKYVLMWEPPLGEPRSNIATTFPRAAGVSQGPITERLAQLLVWKSLMSAGINEDPDIWNAISGDVAGRGFEVNGVSPAGDRWDYFLVPIFSRTDRVTAFVQMAADDGAFESVHVLAKPAPFDPVTKARAELLARGTLQEGETLTSGILTWDPRSNTPFAKAPTYPYYEFGVMNRFKEIGVVRVSFNNGTVGRVTK